MPDMGKPPRLRRPATLAVLGALAAGIWIGHATALVKYPPVEVLLSSGQTIIGQPIEYPAGKPKITAAIVTMEPGQETGWHRHDAPLFAHMMEGTLTVDYGDAGTRQYQAGDSLLEAFRTPHTGKVVGDRQVRVLVVFAGAEGTENTVMVEQPAD